MDRGGISNTPNSVSSVPVWKTHQDEVEMLVPVADYDNRYMIMSSDHNDQGHDQYHQSIPGGEVGSCSSSKSHSEAEKRRRDRINAQLARLRSLIPRSDKMDKAALLGRSVDEVKELKKKALEMSEGVTIPWETDEVVIEDWCDKTMIKASLCCEDRPELLKELLQTLKELKLMVIGADMGCLGGRVKTVLILSATEGHVGALKQPLTAAFTRIASFSNTDTPAFRLTTRRQRIFNIYRS